MKLNLAGAVFLQTWEILILFGTMTYITDSLELGFMSSGVKERKNIFRLIETPFWGQWQVYIMVFQTTSSCVPASCGSALRPYWREIFSRAIYYRGLVTGGLLDKVHAKFKLTNSKNTFCASTFFRSWRHIKK